MAAPAARTVSGVTATSSSMCQTMAGSPWSPTKQRQIVVATVARTRPSRRQSRSRAKRAEDVLADTVVAHYPDRGHLGTEPRERDRLVERLATGRRADGTGLVLMPPGRKARRVHEAVRHVASRPRRTADLLRNDEQATSRPPRPLRASRAERTCDSHPRYVQCCPVPLYLDTGIGSAPGLIRAR